MADVAAYDDTADLAALLTSDQRRVTIPRLDRPYFTRPLLVRGPKTITLEDGVVIEGIAEAFGGPGDCILSAADQRDITIQGNGATLRMACAAYDKTLQWRHVVNLKRCHGVTLQDLHLSGAGGDGIYVGAGCVDVTIRRVRCHANGRQGISVIGCNGLLINGCVLEDTFGNWPGAGLDFEPNAPGEALLRCVVRDTVIRHNRGFGFLVNVDMLDAGSAPVDITLDSCVIEQRAEDGPAVQIMAERSGPDGRVRMRDMQVVGRQRLYLTHQFRVEGL